jgi:hypothetical protein
MQYLRSQTKSRRTETRGSSFFGGKEVSGHGRPTGAAVKQRRRAAARLCRHSAANEKDRFILETRNRGYEKNDLVYTRSDRKNSEAITRSAILNALWLLLRFQ